MANQRSLFDFIEAALVLEPGLLKWGVQQNLIQRRGP